MHVERAACGILIYAFYSKPSRVVNNLISGGFSYVVVDLRKETVSKNMLS